MDPEVLGGGSIAGFGEGMGPTGIQHLPDPFPTFRTLVYETKGATVVSAELGILCDLFSPQRLTHWDIDLPRG